MYRSTARSAGVAARVPRAPLLIDLAILAAAVAFLATTGPVVASAVVTAVDQITHSVSANLTGQLGTGQIDLPTGAGSNIGGAEPVVNGLPDFTRAPQLQLAGRVPSFAIAQGRTVEIVLNGAVVTDAAIDDTGEFATPLTLKDGANVIGLTLLSDKTVVARSSYTVVLDREPPTLAVRQPANGATLDGPNIVVEGKAEVGATVTVNGRTVVTGQDGSFSESFTPTIGPVAITVVATDRAGNETTEKSNVVLRAPAAGTSAVAVTLDRSRVRPGEVVVATIRVTDNGVPRRGAVVTLSVGVITIGSATTDAVGTARIAFASPPNEGDATVVVLAAGASGSAPLTVAR